MHSAAEHISGVIGDDAIPFEQFMELALYGPQGFYTSDGSAGRRGDFITSPEVGPLFGAVIANYLDDRWTHAGQPSEFIVVEHGAGPGTLARSILAANPKCLSALSYVAIEVSDNQRAKHPESIKSYAVAPSELDAHVVLANELLDNLPFKLFVYDNGWREAYVTVGRDGRFNEILKAPRKEDEDFIAKLPPASLGARIPLQAAAMQWLRQAIGTATNGAVLVIDYARERTWDVCEMPWRQWLRTYKGHERGSHYLQDVGMQDITVDVMIDQLSTVAPPLNIRTQSQFLQLWGIDELVEEGQKYWQANASKPDLTAIKMRSRTTEAEALCDPAGLGGFSVVEWG